MDYALQGRKRKPMCLRYLNGWFSLGSILVEGWSLFISRKMKTKNAAQTV